MPAEPTQADRIEALLGSILRVLVALATHQGVPKREPAPAAPPALSNLRQQPTGQHRTRPAAEALAAPVTPPRGAGDAWEPPG